MPGERALLVYYATKKETHLTLTGGRDPPGN